MTRLLRFLLILCMGFKAYGIDEQTPPVLPKIDKILIEKAKRTMTVFSHNEVVKSYRVSLGFAPVGHKQQEGDGKTPEGQYVIESKNPHSRYHLSLKISYPSKDDRTAALKGGVKPGGDIMIHGLGRGFSWMGPWHHLKDWTLGCIAVTNEEIDELYPAIDVGTLVKIVP